MGLEDVELIMALEEAFGGYLNDNDITVAMTPRLMADVIFAKLQARSEPLCPNLQGFNVLRRAFMDQFGLSRKEVVLDMPFRHLIPQAEERRVWAELKERAHARRWPALVRPRWIVGVLVVLALSALALPFMLLWNLMPEGAGIAGLAGAAGMVAVSLVGKKATRPFESRIPSGCQRIRDLVPFAVSSEQVSWTREQVGALVKKTVMEEWSVPEDKYHEDADLMKTLKP